MAERHRGKSRILSRRGMCDLNRLPGTGVSQRRFGGCGLCFKHNGIVERTHGGVIDRGQGGVGCLGALPRFHQADSYQLTKLSDRLGACGSGMEAWARF